MDRWVCARACACALFISMAAVAHLPAIAQESETQALENSSWSGLAQFGAGYDTNANASTGEQTFLGFTLDPRFIETESAFGELTLGADHTAVFGTQRGFNSSLRVAHRANPGASFANISVASLGTEAVWLRGAARFTVGVSGYTDWLDGEDHERAANVGFGFSYQPGDDLETALAVRTSRIGYQSGDLEILDVDRYLAGLSLTRLNLGEHSGSIGFTLLGGRDAPRRAGSPFGNNRIGIQLSTSWLLRPQASLYAEFSGMRSDYAGSIFDLKRKDDQYEAAIALEFADWPAARWSFTPQLRYVRNDSTMSLFEYDRIEAAFYLGRQF